MYALEEQQEFLWWETARGAADAGLTETPCPLCGGTITLSHRTRRMTFGGEEPPCVQVTCECTGGGELSGGLYDDGR